jgi:NAD(P)-dependent dehydrogenase (short-subunit alcohol dehydrogenase family)
MPNKGAVRSSDIPEFWKGYEVNVKGVIVALSAFLLAKGEDAIVVIISIAGITFSKNMTGGFISYNASKHALINLIKYVAIKEPEVHFINIHPDILETSMFDKFNNPDLKPNTCKFIKACVT